MSTTCTHMDSICIAIREPILAGYIYNYLKEKKGYNCLIKVSHVTDLLKFKSKYNNIILYLDIHLSGITDISHAASIIRQVQSKQTIVLCYEEDIPRIEPLYRSNHFGYILKTNEEYLLNAIIKKFRSNKSHTDAAIEKYYKQKTILTKEISGPAGSTTLTDKEFQIATLLLEELKPSQICKRLQVSINTFKTHRKHICEKIREIGFENIEAFLSHLRNMALSY